MTKEEAIKELNSINAGDTELAHVDADNVLINFLLSNGYEDIIQAYVEVDKRCGGFWFA